MDRSTIKVETLDSVVADESILDLPGTDLTDSAPCCSGTNPEDATELKPEGLMNTSVKLGINDEIWNEKSENSSVGPSLRMMSNLVVIAPQDDNFDQSEHFQTNRIPYSPDHQQDISQDSTIPAVKQEIMDVVFKEETSEYASMEEIYDRRDIQSCEEHIKFEDDINCPWVDNLKGTTGKSEAQTIVMKNEMSEVRLPEDIFKSESINGDLSDDQTLKLTFSERVRRITFPPWTSSYTVISSDERSNYNQSCTLTSFEESDKREKKVDGSKSVHHLHSDQSGAQSECSQFNKCVKMDHKRTHKEKPFACTTCDKSYGSQSALNFHWKTHTRENSYIYGCTVCVKSFKTKQALHVHQRKHTGEKPYTCTTCDKSYSTQSYLHVHQRTHTGEKPHRCTTCDKSYKGLSALKYHQRTHTGDKPYACTRCDKSFRDQSNLKSHQRTHREKLYGCTTCDESFSTQSNLHAHQKAHTGEGLFPCEICNKSFTHPISFHNHMITHQNLKLFSCPECDKVFPNESSLKLHSRKHSREKPYLCNTCDKSFKDPYSFKAHHRKHTLSVEKP